MANQLKMALIDTIQRLHQQGWSQRRIARELDIDRNRTTARSRLGAGDCAQKKGARNGAWKARANASPVRNATHLQHRLSGKQNW